MTPKQKRKLLQQKNPPQEMFTRSETEAFARDYAHKVLTNYLAATLMVLRDELKFSKKRITNFFGKESEQAKYMAEKYYTAEDAFKQIELETGFNLSKFIEERAS